MHRIHTKSYSTTFGDQDRRFSIGTPASREYRRSHGLADVYRKGGIEAECSD